MMAPKIITPISVKIAALDSLETLLTAGGAKRSDSWQPDVDRLLVAISLDACKGGWAKEEKNIFLSAGRTDPWSEFQMAALKAFLASLISPSRVRPPFLSQGLELFRKGNNLPQKTTELVAHWEKAMMNDDIYNSWLRNVGEVDIAGTLTENSVTIVAPFASTDPSAENQFSLDKAFSAEVPQISGRREVLIDVSKGIQEATPIVGEIGERMDDEIMTERRGFQDTIQHSVEDFAFQGQTYHNLTLIY
ncbi:hypothetical protein POM88_019975 [Heracleum sosnowskyi]|uniref:Uncharacterized protein n=1 Tax=Heracleum sosnowskyi TaxID=360622 RepID=A0AAD8IE43_9APIA|nr:hypothetical protein POM88_019975 [Heracleum sosnowskyi]